QLVAGSTKERKEIYAVTDLGRAAWSAESAARLRTKLTEKPEVALYVVDVGVDNPQDISLGDLRLSSDVLSKNTPLRLETDLASTSSDAAEKTVTLDLIDAAGQAQRRDQTTVSASAEQAQPIEFQIAGLEQGTHQGVARILGEDSLPADD